MPTSEEFLMNLLLKGGIFIAQLQHLIGVKWLFGRLDSFFMGVVGTTDFIDPVAGMSR